MLNVSVAEARKTSSNYVYVIDSRMDALTPEKDQERLNTALC